MKNKIRKAKKATNQKTTDIAEELDKLKVNTNVEQDKQAWQDIWNNTNNTNNIVDIIRTAVGIDKIYYDKKFKETKNRISEYEDWKINYNESWSDHTSEETINNDLKILLKIANYNLKMVDEVVNNLETKLNTKLKSTGLKKANRKALEFAISYIQNDAENVKKIQALKERCTW